MIKYKSICSQTIANISIGNIFLVYTTKYIIEITIIIKWYNFSQPILYEHYSANNSTNYWLISTNNDQYWYANSSFFLIDMSINLEFKPKPISHIHIEVCGVSSLHVSSPKRRLSSKSFVIKLLNLNSWEEIS